VSPRLLAVLAILFLAPAIALGTRHFEATNRIGVLCIGDTSYGESPVLGWLSLDFAVQWQELPTDVGGVMSDADAKKVTRIYMPRTLERLLDAYDLILLLEPRMDWFGGIEMNRFKQSVEDGVSCILTLWPDDEGYNSLVQNEFASVFPQDFTPTFESVEDVPFTVEVREGNPPVLTPFLPLSIERFTGHKTRPMHPRPGSRIWAVAKKPAMAKIPEDEFMISWTYGEEDAENWAVGVDVDESWFTASGKNEYGGDILLNMIYYSVGKDIPTDVYLVHDLRNAFFQYSVQKKLIFAVIEFVDAFGANTGELERSIAEADRGRSIAEEAFLEADYEGSYDQIRRMIDELAELNERAIEIKDRALLWVYVTEWSAVTGTAIMAGFTLYTLMVGRRLYREVSVTRES